MLPLLKTGDIEENKYISRTRKKPIKKINLVIIIYAIISLFEKELQIYKKEKLNFNLINRRFRHCSI